MITSRPSLPPKPLRQNCRALEAELAALRDRQAQNNGKHPNHNRK